MPMALIDEHTACLSIQPPVLVGVGVVVELLLVGAGVVVELLLVGVGVVVGVKHGFLTYRSILFLALV